MSPTTETAADRKLEAFRPVRVRSAADEVLAVLADAIRGGLYQPGDLLPRERDLAERLGVSRPVVREAIAVLRDAGIVTVRRGQGGGALVGSVANLPSVLRRIAGETRLELRSLLEVRRAVELEAALLTAERAAATELARLTELVDALPAFTGRDQEFYEADVRFHLALGDTSGNPMIAEIIRQTFNRIAGLREPFPHAHVDFDAAVRNQQEYMQAIRERDRGVIAAAVDHHLGDFETVFLGEPLTATPGVPHPGGR
jgi:GntR family transcriptional regulator, transcriptional repressor for pyruvate dehydrogenase complex